MAQKLFRDPLYDYISIDRDKHSWLLDLVNCPELQRLRFISQLGLCQFTYPGSTHSRFSHSRCGRPDPGQGGKGKRGKGKK